MGLSSHSQVNISPNGNFHMESEDIYFSDDVPTFTNKLFYAVPNGSGPIANFPAMGARYQGDGGQRYSDRTAWYSYSGNGYITGTFSFVPQYDQENNPITVNQFVTYCGRRPNASGNCKYTNYKYNSFLIQVEVPYFLNTDAIKIICNTQAPIQIADYFKSTITGVTFKVDGVITSTIEPGSLGLGEHVVTAEKFYNNGNYTGEFRFTILEKPVPVITPNGSTNICEGSNVVLSAPVSPTGQVYTYQWSTGQTSRDITVSNAGNYTVTISNGACSSTSPSISVSTKPVPDRYVNVTGNTSICDGETSILTASNAKSYLWYKDGIATSITTQSITISTAGSYSCVLTGDNGCSVSTNPTVITVKPNPRPTISVTGSLTFCDGDKVTLTAQSTGIPNNYQWSNGQSGQTIQVSTSGIYSVTATNPGSCQSTSIPVVVNVLPNPKPTITAVGPTSFCVGDGVKLIASPGKSYQWSSGETTQEIFVKTPGTFSVEVENTNGCIRVSDPTTITVKQRPNPSIVTEGSLSLCAGQTVKLTSSITGDAYVWFPNGETTQSINVSNAGTYYVQVFKDGCSGNSESRTVTVTNPVIPTIQNLNGLNTPCYGEIVTLQASSGQSFLWSTGETSQAIQITQGGTYFVTTKDAKGCSAVSQSIRIIYKNQFTPIVTASGNTTVCDGDGVLLTATNGKSYLWSNGATTQSVTVFASGAFTCKVTNSEDCTVETPPVTVTVNQRPKPNIVSLSSTTFCQGSSVTLSVGNPVGGANYTWSNGQNGQSITATTGGIYTVTAMYQNGCSAVSNSQVVNVLPISKPTITASGDLDFCEGGSVRLTINETGDKYLWSTGETTKSILVSTTGSYSATITNNNGCSLSSTPISVNVKVAPKPVITSNGPLTLCQGSSVILSVANPVPGANYSWSTGQSGQSLSVNGSGNYIVTAVYTNGCSGVSEATIVKVLPIATPTITASGPLSFCQGGSVTLSVNETGDSYLWSNGETSKSIEVKSGGTYTATITNVNGCSLSSAPVSVQVYQVPKPTVNASGPLTFCQGNSVTLTVSNPQSGANYTWSNGVSGQTTTVNSSGLYSVNASYTTGCSAVSNASAVLVLPIVKPTITASGPLNFCEDGSVTLTINETGDSYLWNTGETTKNLLVRTSGVYTAKIINNNGCSLSSESVAVFVNPSPKPLVSANKPLTFCQGETLTLNVTNPSPGATYTWSNGLTGQSLDVKSAGSYTVTAVYANGCSKISDATLIEVLPIVKPTISASGSLTFCEGQSITLTINESGDNYLWSDGVVGKIRTVTTSGNYVATISNKNGCSLSSSPIVITVNANPKPVIITSGNTTFCAGESIQMSVPATPGFTYKWNTGETTNQITVSQAGNYFVSVTTDKGCTNTSSTIPVIVLPNPKPSVSIKVVTKQ